MSFITFSDVNNLPDILDTSRYQLVIPNIPGVDGKDLIIKQAEVSLPEKAIATIKVKYLGYTTHFRGASSSENTISVSFYEDIKGNSTKSITNWMRLCYNGKDGTSNPKIIYARNCEFHFLDSIGEIAFSFKVLNMWPFSIKLPSTSESSTAAKIDVQFVCDEISLLDDLED